MTNKKVSAGVGVMLRRGDKVLLGLRNADPKKASSELNGEGTWTFPGGKIDYGDSVYEAGVREVKEETNIDIQELEIFCINNNLGKSSQFLTFGLKATKFSGSVQVMEPEEIIEWKSFSVDNLPENLYFPTKKMLNMFKKGEFFNLREK